MCLCKFSQNPPIGLGDWMQTMSNKDADANADRICTKNNMSPLPFGCGNMNMNLKEFQNYK